ncbi:MAG TPA: radical SAM protein [Synergistaceae bacterium]|nr:radical SAM protein [Synergistaceae bacterium]
MKRLPFFLSMEGCPGRCSYCNQHSITGQTSPSPETIKALLEKEESPLEVCYFGGSFTCLAPEKRKAYLKAFRAAPEGSLLRFSTHPLGISSAMVEEIREYPLSQVELGIASLQDEVLRKNLRGYESREVLEILTFLLEAGLPLGCQMMIGLPEQTLEGSLEDLNRLGSLPHSRGMHLRLYPCLVLRHTLLATWMQNGSYIPLSLENAVTWGGQWLLKAEEYAFRVQRVGLCDTPSLHEDTLAGPLHPALGELIRGEALARKLLRDNPQGPWYLSARERSLFFGHGRTVAAKMARLANLREEELVRRIILLPS